MKRCSLIIHSVSGNIYIIGAYLREKLIEHGVDARHGQFLGGVGFGKPAPVVPVKLGLYNAQTGKFGFGDLKVTADNDVFFHNMDSFLS